MKHPCGIELAKDWKGSFASFKKQFGHVEYFRRLLPGPKEEALKEAYEALTGKKVNTKPKSDGNVPGSKGSGKKTKPE